MALKLKQQRFVEEYLVDLNGTQAAIRAGYRPRSAKVTASRLLSKANIRTAVAEERAEAAAKAGLSVEGVLTELANVAFFDLRRAFDPETGRPLEPHKLPAEVARALAAARSAASWSAADALSGAAMAMATAGAGTAMAEVC